MAVPPTAQPNAIPEPVFNILPFPIPIGTENAGTMSVVSPIPHPPVPTKVPKDDEAQADSDLRAAPAKAKEEGEKKVHAEGKHAQDRDNEKEDGNKRTKGDETVQADDAKKEKEEKAGQETNSETAWEAVLNVFTSFAKNVGLTASDYFSKIKSLVIGKNDPVETVHENDNKDASPKVQTREDYDL